MISIISSHTLIAHELGGTADSLRNWKRRYVDPL